MERGFLSSGRRGVKEKKGVNGADQSIFGNISDGYNVVTLGNGADQLPQPDQNVHDACNASTTYQSSQLCRSTATFSASEDTKGPSEVMEGVDEPILESVPTMKFASIDGMKNGLWFIRSAPIIMKKWTPNANLLKEDLNLVLIWVTFHDIPIMAFTTNGLRVMATKLDHTNVIKEAGQQESGSTSVVYVDARNKEANQVRGDRVGNDPSKKFTSSFASKLSPMSLTKANLRKLIANVLNDADNDVWLPLASVHEVNDRMKNPLYGYFIGKRPAFPVVEWFVRNNWEKYGLEKSMDDLRWSPSMSLLKEELLHVPVWLKFHDSSYARILIEINACNDFSDHLVMAVPNLEGNGYTKETIGIEYEWEPPRCSTCLIFGHSPVDCPKAPKAAHIRVVNQKGKGKGKTSRADDEGFIEVKKKKSVALNDDNLIIEEVAKSNMDTTLSTQEEGQTPIVDKINVLEKQIPKGKLVVVDDEGKPLEKVDYPVNLDSNDEVEPVQNEWKVY
nr:hypothetical protein [Tanacetum cinerariifolium]